MNPAKPVCQDLWPTVGSRPTTKREFHERIGAEVMRGGPQEMRSFQNDDIRLCKRIAAQAKVEQQ